MIIPDWAAYLRFRDAFGEVMDPRLYTLDWLDAQLLTGQAMFWATDNAAILAELKLYPTGARDIHGLIAAGDLQDIIESLIPQAEQWARGIGCIGAIIESREGWVKALKPSGYNIHQVSVRKDF